MYLDKAKAIARQLNIASDDMIPCTVEEVQALENQLNHILPEAYKEFLLWIGHKGGSLWRGSDAFHYNLSYQDEIAETLLQTNNFGIPLPEDAFIFFSHQGYMFSFFRLSEGDDPPIYHYSEYKTSHFVRSHDTFSELILQLVTNELNK